MSDAGKVYRTYHIKMEATVENFAKFRGIVHMEFDHEWDVSSTLSELPQKGELWLDGLGNSHLLHETDHEVFILGDDNSYSSWTAKGSYGVDITGKGYEFAPKNLVQRLESPLHHIQRGQYWMDRVGNVYCIGELQTDSKLNPIVSQDGCYSWLINGRCNSTTENDRDLIKQVKVCDVFD